jgi:hypothetical protein
MDLLVTHSQKKQDQDTLRLLFVGECVPRVGSKLLGEVHK